jgi:ribosome-associated translation inhibitor RaiA
MHITVSGMNMLVNADTRGYAEYRLFSAAVPHAAVVKSIDVVLARTVADAQAVSCTVRIDLLPSGQITAHARGRQATAAVDRAADRAGWQLRRRTAQPLS